MVLHMCSLPTTAWHSRQRPSVASARLTCNSAGCNTAPGAGLTTPATVQVQSQAEGDLTSPVCLCRWQCCAGYSNTHTRTCTNAVSNPRQAQLTCAPLQGVVLRHT